jgi:glucokinase
MKVIAIDLGGTKVAAAVVDAKGKILQQKKVPTELGGGWRALKKQLIDLCKELQKEEPKVSAIGIGSAGPLDAPAGLLLDPTNFGWSSPLKVNIVKELKAALRLPVKLENDAAAAILAEQWKGGAKQNALVLTLGTGLGVGVTTEGKLLRGGRCLHPEAGHILLRAGDQSALCGCGNYGCAEAYLSGMNFAARAAKKLVEPGISAIEVEQRARSGDPEAIALFAEYSELMAELLQNFIVLYYPQSVILTGSFANAAPLFLPDTKKRLRALLQRRLKTLPLFPEIRVSRLQNKAGILGAAYIALHEDYATV